MSASMNDDLRRLNQAKQTRHRPKVDEPAPDPKEQRNRAFRLQAFLVLRFGFERGKRREAMARANTEAARKLQETLDKAKAKIAAAGGNPDGLNSLVITPPTILKVKTATAELAKKHPAA